MATLMERLNKALEIEKPLSPSLIKEYNEIRSMFSPAKRKKLDALMNKMPGAFSRGRLAKKLVKQTGGAEAQKKARQGGNPDIQKKQGFVGAKAKGGKVMPKKKLMYGGKVKKK